MPNRNTASATVWGTRPYRFFGASLLHHSTAMTESSSTHTRSGIQGNFLSLSCCLNAARHCDFAASGGFRLTSIHSTPAPAQAEIG